jgi:hypothetical protein
LLDDQRLDWLTSILMFDSGRADLGRWFSNGRSWMSARGQATADRSWPLICDPMAAGCWGEVSPETGCARRCRAAQLTGEWPNQPLGHQLRRVFHQNEEVGARNSPRARNRGRGAGEGDPGGSVGVAAAPLAPSGRQRCACREGRRSGAG